MSLLESLIAGHADTSASDPGPTGGLSLLDSLSEPGTGLQDGPDGADGLSAWAAFSALAPAGAATGPAVRVQGLHAR